MKLCTALGWKVCCVSLHDNLDALEVTHRTHSGPKTKKQKTKQSLEEMQAEPTVNCGPTVQEASGSLLPLQTLLNRHAALRHESV